MYLKKSQLRLLLPVLSIFLLNFTACDLLDDVTESVEVTATASATDLQPGVGVEIELDGRQSRASDNSSLTFSWAIESRPDGSTAQIVNANEPVARFTPDSRGEFRIVLTVGAGGETDEAAITIDAGSTAVLISGTINDDRTLISDNDYRVTGFITVNGELTIEPGTVIRFDEDAGFRFESSSTIIFEGTEADPILFTGTQETPGWWRGLHIRNTRSLNNVMDWIIIEYAGNNLASSLQIGETSSLNRGAVKLTNSIVRHSSGPGLWLSHDSELRESENNTFTQNQGVPVHTFLSAMHYLSSANTYTGNTNDYVLVADRNTSGDDRTWQSLDVPYRITGLSTITETEITIAPGTRIEYGESAQLRFDTGSTIRFIGTEDEPIHMYGSQETAGWWDGLFLRNSRSLNNRIEHTIIEHAGRDLDGAITLGTTSSLNYSNLALVNSTIRHSGSYGFWASNDTEFTEFSNNTLTANASGAGFLYTSNAGFLDSDSDYTGNQNGNDFVFVEARNNSVSQTFSALNVPYHINGIATFTNNVTTIEAGAMFHFRQEAGLRFDSDSGIRAIGTPENPIVFTGTGSESGWWGSIHLRNSRDTDNIIEYAEFSNGGRSVDAMLILGTGSSLNRAHLTLRNSSFSNSSSGGIDVSNDSVVNDDICTVNTFNNNSGPNCQIR